MSLTDLKKSSDGKGNKKKFTVDEFISDSENYAKGAPELVSGDIAKQHDLAKAIAGAKDLVALRAKQEQEKEAQAAVVSAKEKAAQDKQARKVKKRETSTAKAKVKSNKKYRHATFTLSEEVIQQLQYLSNETNLAKSHIIRILIKELDDQEKIDQLELILGSKID
jgi:hypothetical protein